MPSRPLLADRSADGWADGWLTAGLAWLGLALGDALGLGTSSAFDASSIALSRSSSGSITGR
jgi:hypothetical protein